MVSSLPALSGCMSSVRCRKGNMASTASIDVTPDALWGFAENSRCSSIDSKLFGMRLTSAVATGIYWGPVESICENLWIACGEVS